jgi:hypothetical protein
MAKQHVSTIERHVEKIVLGLGGAVLAGVAFLYMVQSPNTVELGAGEPAGPGKLYLQIGEQAQAAANKAQRGGDPGIAPVPRFGGDLNPLQVAKLEPSFEVPISPIGVDVPPPPGTTRGPSQKIELAEVIAPSPPVLNTGRATAALPKVEYISVSRSGETTVDDSDKVLVPRDTFWVTLAGLVNREKQNEMFRAARYEPEQDVLVAAAIEVERQELLGDGRWSEPTLVLPYAQQVLRRDVQKVRVFSRKDGSYEVLEDALEVITGYRDLLSDFEAQADVLRPQFQTLLDQEQSWRWTVPKQLTAFGTKVDLTDERWGLYFLPDEEKGRRPSDRGGTDDRIAQRKALDDFEKAKLLLEQREYLEAGKILKEVMSSNVLRQNTMDEVEDVWDEYEEQILDAMNADADRQERAEKRLEQQFGPDYDPYWATDVSIEPGRTYRYRVRVLSLNRYAGMPNHLADPMMAGQVLLPGEWSEWSEPVAVLDSTYLLATQDADPNELQISLYEYKRNEWDTGRDKLSLGQELQVASAANTGKGVLVDFTATRSFPMQSRDRDGVYLAVIQPTTSVTVVDESGEVREQFQPLDSQVQDQLREVIREQKKKEKLASESGQVGRSTTGRPVGRSPAAVRSPNRPRDRGGDRGGMSPNRRPRSGGRDTGGGS